MREKLPDCRVETVRMVDDDNRLEFVFENGEVVSLKDTAEYCCESRWMSCDDELESFRGDRVLRWELTHVREEGDAEESASDRYGNTHEVAFLRVFMASGNVITCQTHNSHNGYYGGFHVEVLRYTLDN